MLWARPDSETNRCLEIIDFDPEGRFHADVHFYPIPEALEPYIDYNFIWDGSSWIEETPGYLQGKIKSQRKREILAALAALDAEAISLRTLANAALGDQAASDVLAGKMAAHEDKAGPLRAELAGL
jgi:hypothetical protein